MRSEQTYLLLARSGRTPHALPTHRGRGDPRQAQRQARERASALAQARQPPQRPAVRLRAGFRRTQYGA